MAYFGEDFLQGFFGADGLKDYQHASKTFRTNGYGLLPRYKFLFHVFFNLNTAQIPALANVFGNDVGTIGLMVKTAQLPNYTIGVDTLNQYNRKRLVQTKIEYDPVQITLHDDQDDLIRNMWYNYYSYYYKDPTEPYENQPGQNGSAGQLQASSAGFGYNTRDTYTPRQTTDWGFIGESYTNSSIYTATSSSKPGFFRDIKIYGLSQKQFASWVLINPLITNWQHDTYDYAAGSETMQNTMTIKYETVKYYEGAIGGSHPSGTVTGFADPTHYDTVPSSLSRPGQTQTVFGQGGLLDAGAGFLTDLQAGNFQGLLGAVQIAGASYNTFKNKNLGQIAGADIQNNLPGILQQSLPGTVRQVIGSGASNGNGMIFPTNNTAIGGQSGSPTLF